MFDAVSVSAARVRATVLITATALAMLLAAAYSTAPADASIYWQQQYSTNNGPIVSELGRANSDGTNATKAYRSEQVDGIDTDGTYIYWADSVKGSIGRVGVNGDGANANFITGAPNASAVTVGAGGIYWVNQQSGTIGRANLDGSGATVSLIGNAGAIGVAIDATYLYWTSENGSTIGRANLDGGGVNANFVAGAPINLGGIAVNATSIYFASSDPQGTNGGEGVWRANIDGSGAALLTAAPNSASDVALDATYVYWSDTGNAGADAPSGFPSFSVGAIGRMPLDNSAPANTALITGLGFPNLLAVDATTSATSKVLSRKLRIKRNRSRAIVSCSGTGSCFGTLSIVTAPKYRVGKNRRARLTLATGTINQLAGKRAGVALTFNSKSVRRAFGRKSRIVAYAQAGSGKLKRVVLVR